MTVLSGIITWLFNNDMSLAIKLGFLSIPFTVILSLETGPSYYDFGAVSFAALLAGLYYSSRFTASARAGLRTGVIGGLPAAWNSIGIISSGWAISPGYAALGIAFSLLWLCFALAVGGFIGITSAVIGNIIGHIPIFRRIGPQTV
ncbi:DUF5518 domain-containing protein [Halorubrum sp. LN27]|uniref:DUF5518 domain-containing protein n=1 Tax=Halorubrum sp. LN27 TaxID=2801032 RepID=UPI00190B41AB|nr:DUF5518 domain-containing protein [Halorubrum sp. LN27]